MQEFGINIQQAVNWTAIDKGQDQVLKGTFEANGKAYKIEVKYNKNLESEGGQVAAKIQSFIDEINVQALAELSGHSFGISKEGEISHLKEKKAVPLKDLNQEQLTDLKINKRQFETAMKLKDLCFSAQPQTKTVKQKITNGDGIDALTQAQQNALKEVKAKTSDRPHKTKEKTPSALLASSSDLELRISQEPEAKPISKPPSLSIPATNANLPKAARKEQSPPKLDAFLKDTRASPEYQLGSANLKELNSKDPNIKEIILKKVVSDNTASWGSNSLLRKREDEGKNFLNTLYTGMAFIDSENVTSRQKLAYAKVVKSAQQLEDIVKNLTQIGLKEFYNDNMNSAGKERPNQPERAAKRSTEGGDYRIVDDFDPKELSDQQKNKLIDAKEQLSKMLENLKEEEKQLDNSVLSTASSMAVSLSMGRVLKEVRVLLGEQSLTDNK